MGYESVTYNENVIDFLNYLKENGFTNHLLSSGIKTFLNKISIATFFKSITATIFTYNKDNEIIDIEYLMSDKRKIDAIKKINIDNGKKENDCSNIIYIGDGLTDIYAMEYVKNNGGISIFVYQNEDAKNIAKMKEEEGITFFIKRDFSLDGELLDIINTLSLE